MIHYGYHFFYAEIAVAVAWFLTYAGGMQLLPGAIISRDYFARFLNFWLWLDFKQLFQIQAITYFPGYYSF